LHPVAYFYNRGGAFSPWAFLAWSKTVDDLFARKQANRFCEKRPEIEQYLIEHKWAMTPIIHTNGSGHRSTPWLERYCRFVTDLFFNDTSYNAVVEAVYQDAKLGFLKFKDPFYRISGENNNKSFSKSTMTAAIWDSALPGAPRCHVFNGYWHRNSYHGDHIVEIRNGGDARPKNAGIAHPYCDSSYNDYLARSQRASP
jgi:hypothetical protein